MSQTCTRCSRINPVEASYCYYDGSALPGHSRNGGGPVAVGSKPFQSPFVFPSGRSCRSFDELALACQQDWAAAKDVLKNGFLERFLSGQGRSDLALAAREAAKFPDKDRGLDQFLEKLPSNALEPPKLRAHPQDVSLGVVPVGEDRKFDLHLENQGMRLLYGTVRCEDSVWLALGDGPGAPEKLFEFGAETTIPVHVRGKQLRASNKPLEGQLVIESNGGTVSVAVRADVPVKPYPDGVLAGARSPRQVAEKAKLKPKESAVLFEKGAVARWYKSNGWSYPVQGPSASGLGAVQQFFEALGLTPPPKVDVSERSVTLQGNVGVPLKHTLEIKAQEKRPVYAYGKSNQPWLEVGRARLNGRTATIPLVVPSVPDREGETLTAKVVVTSNGNQRFVIPVTLIVGGSFQFGGAVPEAEVQLPEPLPISTPAPALAPTAIPMGVPSIRRPEQGLGVHLLPAILLGLVVIGAIVYDAMRKPPDVNAENKSLGITGRAAPEVEVGDTEPRLGIQFNERMRYGIVMLKVKDPNYPDKHKRLTYQEDGGSNNTCVRLDGYENLFGQSPGKWKEREKKTKDGRSTRSVWIYTLENVQVTQTVDLVRGDQTRVLDTCLVRYLIENLSTVTHKVGLRVMLDTYIGANDGVPFVIPGQPGLLDTMKKFSQKEIPDFIQALEKGDLANPGTIAHMGLKIPGSDIEPIESMVVCRWPENSEARWEWPYQAMNDPPEKKDSCIVLYWADRPMAPKEKRELAFTYGLNTISSLGKTNATLSLTVGGSFKPHGEFTVTAYIKNPQKDQKVRLTLPKGLTLLPGHDAEQVVDRTGDLSQVSWRVRAGEVGIYDLEVSSGLEREGYRVRIKTSSIFD